MYYLIIKPDLVMFIEFTRQCEVVTRSDGSTRMSGVKLIYAYLLFILSKAASTAINQR
jgi:hypothetical protein